MQMAPIVIRCWAPVVLAKKADIINIQPTTNKMSPLII